MSDASNQRPFFGSPFLASMQRAAQLRQQREQQPSTQMQRADDSPSSEDNVHISEASSTDTQKTHSVHNVLTIATRASIVNWMTSHAAQNGEKHIPSKSIREFPQFFRASENANLTRAKRLWKDRNKYGDHDGTSSTRGVTSSVTRVTMSGLKRVRMRATPVRGRKRSKWVEALHMDLPDKFYRLRKLGVKFNGTKLKYLALYVLRNSQCDAYSYNLVDPATDVQLHRKIDHRWIQTFTDRFRIVCRSLKGSKSVSPAKLEDIEKDVAVHLGKISGKLSFGLWDEEDIGNADETHFVINVDNGKTLGFCGDKQVKYGDIVSGGEGFTMMVRLSGGSLARIEPPFLIFKNKDRNYPIRGVPESHNGVAYRTGPKGWIDSTVMPQWLAEVKVIGPLPNERKRILFMDNCSGHTLTEDLLAAASKINTEIHFFPPNCTDLVQPYDSLVIQNIKMVWRNHWELYKMEKNRRGVWADASGKIGNPGKSYFLGLAARRVREVNHQRDEFGLSFARKAMILTGLAKNRNGVWELSQLNPELQAIIKKHQLIFDAARDAEKPASGE